VNQELINFISNELKTGKSQDVIRNELMQSGWKEEDINNVFQNLNNQNSQAGSSSFFSKFLSQDPKRYYPTISSALPQSPNRLWAIPLLGGLIKYIIIIPVAIELYFLYLFNFILMLINPFSVLVRGKYVNFAYVFNIGLMRLTMKISFFLFGITDKYPGFSFNINDNFSLDIPFPEKPNKVFAIPIFGIIIRTVFLIPFNIFTGVVSMAVVIGGIIASFPVLFTGKYPQIIYELVIDQLRLSQASFAYANGLSDTYPSFYISFKNKIIKIILILITIIVVGFPIFSLAFTFQNFSKIFQNSNKYNTSTPKIYPKGSNGSNNYSPTITDKTANWKIYTNTKVGYQFKFPDRYDGPRISNSPPVSATGTEEKGVIIGDTQSDFYMLYVFPFVGTIEELRRTRKNDYGYPPLGGWEDSKDIAIEEQTLHSNNIEGLFASVTYTNPQIRLITPHPGRSIFFLGKNRAFVLYGWSSRSKDELPQMFSTFKFTQYDPPVTDITPTISSSPTNCPSGLRNCQQKPSSGSCPTQSPFVCTSGSQQICCENPQ